MKKSVLILFSAVMILMTGCTPADNSILPAEQTTIINGYEFPIDAVDTDTAYITADDVTYLDIGETVNSYVHFLSEEAGEFEQGVKGLTYTLNSVTVYNSISDSGVSFDDTCGLYDDTAQIRNNKFIVADMTADYNSPDGSDAPVNVALNFAVMFWHEKAFDYGNVRPSLIWFSMHPDETDEELDRNHDYFVFRIKTGESVQFKLGILAGESYVNDGDVYLSADSAELKMEGYTYYHFRLLSDKTEFMYGESATR